MRRFTLLLGLLACSVALAVGAAGAAIPTTPSVRSSVEFRPAPLPSSGQVPGGLTIAARIGPIGAGIQPGTKNIGMRVESALLFLDEAPRCDAAVFAARPPRCAPIATGAMRIAYRYGFKDAGIPARGTEPVALYLRRAGPGGAHLIGRTELPFPDRAAVFSVRANRRDYRADLAIGLSFPRDPWEGATIESFHLTFPKTLPGPDGPVDLLKLHCPPTGEIVAGVQVRTYSDLGPFGDVARAPCR